MGDNRMKTILELCREAADILGVERPKDLLSNSENNRLWLNLANEVLSDLNSQEFNCNIKAETFELKDDKRIDISEWFPDFKHYVKYTHFFALDNQMRLMDMLDGVFSGNNLYTGKYLKFKIQDNIIEILEKSEYTFYISFLYNTKVILWDYDNFTDKMILTKNTDVPIYPEDLVRRGLTYFYQKQTKPKDSFDDYMGYKKWLEFYKYSK